MADFMKVDMSRLGQAEGDLRIPACTSARCDVDTFSKPCGGVRLTNGRVPEEMSPTGAGLPMLSDEAISRGRSASACFPG